jgi:hypothetical protein
MVKLDITRFISISLRSHAFGGANNRMLYLLHTAVVRMRAALSCTLLLSQSAMCSWKDRPIGPGMKGLESVSCRAHVKDCHLWAL